LHSCPYSTGENNCGKTHDPASALCCTQGFTAITGWDPVTGLGSVNYSKLLTVLGPASNSDDANANDDTSHKNGITNADVIGVSVVGAVVGAGAIGAAVYFSFFASTADSGVTIQPQMNPVEATKSPMV
jgi:hypothetical protein